MPLALLLAQDAPLPPPAYPPEIGYWIGLSVVAGAVILRLGEAVVKVIGEWKRGRVDIITARSAADTATAAEKVKSNKAALDAATTLLGIYNDRLTFVEAKCREQDAKIDDLEEKERKCQRQVGRLQRVLIAHDLMKAVEPDSDSDPPSPVPSPPRPPDTPSPPSEKTP